jgi:hypothetical protein
MDDGTQEQAELGKREWFETTIPRLLRKWDHEAQERNALRRIIESETKQELKHEHEHQRLEL